MARPAAVCPNGKGMKKHLMILDFRFEIVDMRKK
jgi:hypothetical protein